MSKSEAKVFIIRATFLSGQESAEQKPYRDLTIPSDYTLYSLAETVVEQFGMEFTHAFGFYDNLEKWDNSRLAFELFADVEGEEETKTHSVKENHISRAFEGEGAEMLLVYDYGEEYKIHLKVTAVEDRQKGENYPGLVDAFGKGPVPGGEIEPLSFQVDLSDAGPGPVLEDGDRHFYDIEEESLKRVAKLFRFPEEKELPSVNMQYLEIFYDHLIKHVNFPFYGVFGEQKEEDIVYHNVEVLGLIDPDETSDLDKFGILAQVNLNNQLVKMPLAEIVINQGDPNYEEVEDFCVWYWNYR